MQSRKIKAVIFDVGGVLRKSNKSIKNIEDKSVHYYVAKKLKMNLDTWFDSIDSIFADSMEGKVDEKTTVKIMSGNLGISSKTLRGLFKEVNHKYFKRNQELYKIALQLKAKGYKIGIVSDQWHLSKIDLMPKKDTKEFYPVLISCDVGLRKQNSKMFKLLIKKLKQKDKTIKVRNIIFIDNREWNLKPAREVGIGTILFKNNKQVLREMKKKGIKW